LAEPALEQIRHVRMLDLDVEIACHEAAAGAAIGALLETFAVTTRRDTSARRYSVAHDRGCWALVCAGETVARCSSAASIASALLVELNRAAIDAFRGFAVHAGVVATNGAAIAWPGASGTGKSTLAAACTTAGFEYVSDEALCVDPATTSVIPYPKPITLDRSGWARVGSGDACDRGIDDGDEVMMPADRLPMPVARSPLHLAHVVELARRDGPARLVERTRQDGLAQLLRMSFNHYKDPRTSFELASKLAAGSRVWTLEYSDPREAARLMRVELAGR